MPEDNNKPEEEEEEEQERPRTPVNRRRQALPDSPHTPRDQIRVNPPHSPPPFRRRVDSPFNPRFLPQARRLDFSHVLTDNHPINSLGIFNGQVLPESGAGAMRVAEARPRDEHAAAHFIDAASADDEASATDSDNSYHDIDRPASR